MHYYFVICFLISTFSLSKVIHKEEFHIINQRKVIDPHLLVETANGKIWGKYEKGSRVFLGIPFAEPPIGKLRFRPPRPRRGWAPHVYKAHNFSADCLQSELYEYIEEFNDRDEDCLYLNVWTPIPKKFSKTSSSLYPVMIWIYGGAFIQGGAYRHEYDGARLSNRDVIVVTFNYRVGALGFLVSTADGLYGNYGLDDQKTAIQWVQDNIERFGGDPNQVTLFGESAGAMSSGLHLLDQHKSLQEQIYKKHLFRSVIMQSNPFGYKYRSVAVANFIGSSYKAQLDCEDLNCLQNESAEELIHVQDSLMAVPRSIGDFFTWGPVITDASYEREVRLRPGPLSNITVNQPIDYMKMIENLDIPIIVGANSHEGTVFVFTAFPAKMAKILYQTFVFSFFRGYAPKVLNVYSKLTKEIDESPYPDYRLVLAQIIGDYLFRCPNQYFAAQTAAIDNPVYLYEFAFPTKTPGYPCCDGLSCHTCELPYAFNNMDIIKQDYAYVKSEEITTQSIGKGSFPDIFGTASNWFEKWKKPSTDYQSDLRVSNLMADYWTTFSRYGDPNGVLSLDSNGYIAETSPSNAPWWPALLGLHIPNRNNDIHSKLFKGKPKTKPIRNNTSTSPLQTIANIFNIRLGEQKSINSLGSFPVKKSMHKMLFNEDSIVHITENDCICSFWNALNYRF